LNDVLPTVSPTDVQTYSDFNALAELRTQAQTRSPEALKAVAQQFESLFLDMMMKSMRDANLGNGLFDSNETQFYQEMWDKQIAMQLAKGKGFGIADLVLRQLQQANAAPPAAGEAAKPPASVVDHAASFLRTVLPLAQRAATKLGAPPLALVAQAALETAWGTRVPRRADGSSSFNLFGIKSGANWSGPEAVTRTLEYQNGALAEKRAAFRAYGSAEEGFSDYVSLLAGDPRYQSVIAAAKDPQLYAQALQDSGYATDPNYAMKINTIYSSQTLRAALAQLKDGTAEPIP
jgi:flagellar protein FlgJ